MFLQALLRSGIVRIGSRESGFCIGNGFAPAEMLLTGGTVIVRLVEDCLFTFKAVYLFSQPVKFGLLFFQHRKRLFRFIKLGKFFRQQTSCGKGFIGTLFLGIGSGMGGLHFFESRFVFAYLSVSRFGRVKLCGGKVSVYLHLLAFDAFLFIVRQLFQPLGYACEALCAEKRPEQLFLFLCGAGEQPFKLALREYHHLPELLGGKPQQLYSLRIYVFLAGIIKIRLPHFLFIVVICAVLILVPALGTGFWSKCP